MTKSDPIEIALNQVSNIRAEQDCSKASSELAKFLKHRSHLVVAKAAKLAGELRFTDLVPDLVSAFERLLVNPAKLDKRCAATVEIATALFEMDYTDATVYLRGIRHVQMEGSYGPPVDEAAKLRAVCALGLARTSHPEALIVIAELLADKEAPARVGAIRALAANGGDAGVMLLRYKALIGDRDTAVLTECFAALLDSDFTRSLKFVTRFMDDTDEDVSASAILAIGACRRKEAFDALRDKWDRSVYSDVRTTLLTAMAMVRVEEATDFLVDLLESSATATAVEVVKVLAAYHREDRVREQVKKAIDQRGTPELRAAFNDTW